MDDAQNIISFLLLMILLVSLLLYVVLDGFDLGVGTLALTESDGHDRHEMMETIATVWDGNESWMVLAGAALFAGFPFAFGVVLPALYIPVTVMALALVFRGVAFEFQAQYEEYKHRWGLSFSLGSLVAAFSQGVILGALLTGIPVVNGQPAGGALDFLAPFSLLTGLFVTAFYVLSGAAWLVYKTEGELLESSRRKGRRAAVACGGLLPVTVLAAAFSSPVAANAVAGFRLPLVAGVGAVAVAALVAAYLTLGSRDDGVPLLYSSLSLAALVAAVAVAAFPYLAPPDITYLNAAAPASSAILILVFVGPAIPVTIAYNAYAYWVFRGKQHPEAGA
ncbi:MAG: cytochrome d ubiquinol oxidase subunit II [Rubrobacteraceae bacterium]